MKIRKAGVPPFMKTKYDIQKGRPIEDYLSNKVPMQSDKLKITRLCFVWFGILATTRYTFRA